MENDHEKVADGGSVGDLKQSGNKVCSVQKIDHVTDAKGYGADCHGNTHVILRHHPKEKAAENDLLDKADIQHRQNVADDLGSRVIDIDAVPQIDGNDEKKREKIQVPPRRLHSLKSVVGRTFQKQDQKKKRSGKSGIDQHGAKILHTEALHTKGIDHDIKGDQAQTKQGLVFFKKFFHRFSSRGEFTLIL